MRILPGAAFFAGAAVTALVRRAGGESVDMVDWEPILASATQLSRSSEIERRAQLKLKTPFPQVHAASPEVLVDRKDSSHFLQQRRCYAQV